MKCGVYRRNNNNITKLQILIEYYTYFHNLTYIPIYVNQDTKTQFDIFEEGYETYILKSVIDIVGKMNEK